MIVKINSGNKEGHCRIVECVSLHFENKGKYTEMIYHGPAVTTTHGEIHLGEGSRDHVYIMDKGETVDHLIFEDHRGFPPPKEG